MIESKLNNAIDALNVATQIDDLKDILRDSVSAHAVDCIVFGCLCDGVLQDNVTNLSLSHYGAGWMKRYLGSGDKRLDEIAVRMGGDFTPFEWEPLLRGVPASEGTIRNSECCRLSFLSGTTLPLYVWGHVRHFVHFISMSHKLHFTATSVSALTILAILARNKAQQLGIAHHEEILDHSLSNRERQCIRWISVGKTDWETSRILGLSQKTVQNYVYSARRKLNAVSRAQAVKQALNLGII